MTKYASFNNALANHLSNDDWIQGDRPFRRALASVGPGGFDESCTGTGVQCLHMSCGQK